VFVDSRWDTVRVPVKRRDQPLALDRAEHLVLDAPHRPAPGNTGNTGNTAMAGSDWPTSTQPYWAAGHVRNALPLRDSTGTPLPPTERCSPPAIITLLVVHVHDTGKLRQPVSWTWTTLARRARWPADYGRVGGVR
jgi:hypothetical protein